MKQLLTTVFVSTPWAIKKRCHFYFYDNFGKCGPFTFGFVDELRNTVK